MSTSRLEAFSDGVIAVAITLLVLDIHVPSPGGGDLAASLGHQWPQYAAYAISFITIGIIWINHHIAISRLRQTTRALMIINLFLLMSIAIIPFGTSLMAQYLKAGQGEHLAAAVYGGIFLLMALAFSALNVYTLHLNPQLMHTELPDAQRHLTLRRSVSGVIPYAIATALAPVSPYVTLAICGALAVFYALPAAVGEGISTRLR